jgi:hypothetical protein
MLTTHTEMNVLCITVPKICSGWLHPCTRAVSMCHKRHQQRDWILIQELLLPRSPLPAAGKQYVVTHGFAVEISTRIASSKMPSSLRHTVDASRSTHNTPNARAPHISTAIAGPLMKAVAGSCTTVAPCPARSNSTDLQRGTPATSIHMLSPHLIPHTQLRCELATLHIGYEVFRHTP